MLGPPHQTYSSVGQAGFHRCLSAHEPPHEFIVSMGLAQAHPNNTRSSMGLANNNGLPVGTDAGALSNKTKPCNTVFFRGETQNIPGGTGTPGERGHCRGTIDPGKLCLSNLPSGEEGRGLRPVVNLKNLNCFIQTEHFKMEGLHTLPDLIQWI